MFYDVYANLCTQKGVSESKAAESVGLNRSAVAKWKKGALPGGQTVQKLADYFDVTTDYLLGTETEKAPTPEGERKPSDEDIKFALFGGGGEITDAMFDEVKNFAAYIKQREEGKRKG